MISLRLQGKPFTITVIQVDDPTTNPEAVEVEQLYEDLKDLLELTAKKKRCPFNYRGMECKSRKSRDAWSNKFDLGVQNEAGQRLTEFCQENKLVTANTILQQHERRLYTWTSPDGQYQNQIDYILYNWSERSSIESAKNKTGSYCGSDHEFPIEKFRLKLKKTG